MRKYYVIFTMIIILIMIITVNVSGKDSISFIKKQNIKFDSLSMEDGLSNDVVYTIAQDKRGFMWFGTNDKLNKYNGYDFSVYAHDPDDPHSIPTNSASNIYIDSSDNLWIGTWGGGLIKYNYSEKKFTSYKHENDNPFSISDNRVQTLFEDDSGRLWVGTYEGGLNRFEKNNEKFIRYQYDPNNPNSISHNRIWGISDDQKGNLIIATSDGLNYFDIENEEFKCFYYEPDNEKSIASSKVRTVHRGKKGRIWIGTERGISLFNTERENFKNYIPENENFNLPPDVRTNITTTILEDKNERLWVGTAYGLFKFDIEKRDFVSHYQANYLDTNSLNNNDVRALYQDRSGVIWIGSRGGGINKFNPNSVFSYLHDNSNERGVRAIVDDKLGSLWISKRRGVFKYNLHNGKTKKMLDKQALSLYVDSFGYIWLGCLDGTVYKYDHKKDDFKKYQILDHENNSRNNIISFCEDDNHDLWIGTDGRGLYRFDPDTEQVIEHYEKNTNGSISGNEIYTIYKDSNDRLWVGTNYGLNLFERDKKKFIKYSDGYVYSIYEDSKTGLWFGSRSGLYNLKLDSIKNKNENKLRLFDMKDGLSNNMIFSILDDNSGNLWLSTSFGITKFDMDKLNFRNYSKIYGLQDNKFYPACFTKTQDGELYFGGLKGITSFYPDEIKVNKKPPPIVITDFKKNGKSVSLNKPINSIEKINLSHKDVFFSIEFAALDFIDPEENKYAYKLVGFDKDWNYTGNRHYSSYTNLDPGKYTFRVKGANSDGIWNEKGKSIFINVIPAFWQTGWFKGLIIFLIFIIGIVFFRYKTIKVRKRNMQLEKAVDKRTISLKKAKESLEEVNQELEQEIVQRKKAEKSIKEVAYYDHLTELPNRRLFMELGEKELAHAKRENKLLFLLFIDLDKFKYINDTYGHDTGDTVLIEIAKRIKNTLRESDISCRIGGDEIIILLKDIKDVEGAITVAEKIIKKITQPIKVEGDWVDVGASIGISIFPTDDEDFEQLIIKADKAMYEAKQVSKSTYQLYSEM